MSFVMRKPAFCICKNKKRRSASRISAFFFCCTDSTIPLHNKSKISILCGCTAWFVSDLVGNPKDQFSHNKAQMVHIMITSSVDSKRLLGLLLSLNKTELYYRITVSNDNYEFVQEQ